jgi:hypothetical protein
MVCAICWGLIKRKEKRKEKEKEDKILQSSQEGESISLIIGTCEVC